MFLFHHQCVCLKHNRKSEYNIKIYKITTTSIRIFFCHQSIKLRTKIFQHRKCLYPRKIDIGLINELSKVILGESWNPWKYISILNSKLLFHLSKEHKIFLIFFATFNVCGSLLLKGSFIVGMLTWAMSFLNNQVNLFFFLFKKFFLLHFWYFFMFS